MTRMASSNAPWRLEPMGSVDKIRDHEAPWGVHRQGGFIDPFGHLWLVGDRSPQGTYEPR